MGHGYVIQGTQYIKSFSMKIDHACFHQNIVFFFFPYMRLLYLLKFHFYAKLTLTEVVSCMFT